MLPGNWSWMDNSTYDFQNWGPSEPENLSMSCAAENIQNGYWSSDDCFKAKPFVCEVPDIVPTTQHVTINLNFTTTKSYPAYENCSHGWIYFEPTHSCYGKDQTVLLEYTWTDSEQYCLNQNAHLFSLHSFEETKFVAGKCLKNNDIYFYCFFFQHLSMHQIVYHGQGYIRMTMKRHGIGQMEVQRIIFHGAKDFLS